MFIGIIHANYQQLLYVVLQHVTHVSSPYWITSLGYSPLLRFSTLAPLVAEYFPEGVGVSPTTVNFSTKRDVTDDMTINNNNDGMCIMYADVYC